MPFVIDASIAACWVLPDERDPVAERAFARLVNDFVVAPALWWFELRNLMIVNERRGRLDVVMSTKALGLIDSLPLVIDHEADGDLLINFWRAAGA